jgi:peptidoglycan-associated lipoprotein
MRATLIAILSAAGLAVLLGACSSAPQSQPPASVEERKPGVGDTAKPVESRPVTPVDVTGAPAGSALNPLKDPANVLSKRSIYYDFDKFEVKDEYRGLVEAHAKYLRENPGARMLIQGNTDERGSREYNVSLGQRRSDGVKKMMVLLGAREGQVESVSLGEEKPQAEGRTEDAWARNRRSDMLHAGEF